MYNLVSLGGRGRTVPVNRELTALLTRILLGVLITVATPARLFPAPLSGDAQLFVSGFTACQNGEYGVAVRELSRLLRENPASPLRDMSLFWLARASFRKGDRPEAARVMSRFLKEYPDHLLAESVEEELLLLARQYDLAGGESPVPELKSAPERLAPPLTPDPFPPRQRPPLSRKPSPPAPAAAARGRGASAKEEVVTAASPAPRRELAAPRWAPPLPATKVTAVQPATRAVTSGTPPSSPAASRATPESPLRRLRVFYADVSRNLKGWFAGL